MFDGITFFILLPLSLPDILALAIDSIADMFFDISDGFGNDASDLFFVHVLIWVGLVEPVCQLFEVDKEDEVLFVEEFHGDAFVVL